MSQRPLKWTIDPARTARAAVLALWTLFFVWLWASGELSRYLGPRTYWVVGFGAVTLACATLAHLVTLRAAPRRGRLELGDAAGLALLVVPVLAVLVIPEPELGALAASKKGASGAAAGVGPVAPPPRDNGAPRFIDIHYGSQSESYARVAGVADGVEVSLLGFVTRSGASGSATFDLTRFQVSCCAADAVAFSVPVDASTVSSSAPPDDAWLRVSGVLSAREGRFVLVAREIEETREPKNPYLY